MPSFITILLIHAVVFLVFARLYDHSMQRKERRHENRNP